MQHNDLLFNLVLGIQSCDRTIKSQRFIYCFLHKSLHSALSEHG